MKEKPPLCPYDDKHLVVKSFVLRDPFWYCKVCKEEIGFIKKSLENDMMKTNKGETDEN